MELQGWNVTAVVRKGSDRSSLPAGITAVEHDGTTEGLIAIVAKERPDVVFHLASVFVAEHTSGDLTPLIESNVLFGAQLLEAMDRCGCKRLVDAATSWLHFLDRDYDPVSLYAATKQAFADVATFYVNARGFSQVTLELFDTYGPGDRRPKLFNVLREAAESGTTLAMSPGEQLVDIVYIDDVVAAFELGAARVAGAVPGTRESFVVSSGAGLPLRDLVGTWADVSGMSVEIDWGGRGYRAREVMVPFSGGATLPGWKVHVGLREGLSRMGGLSGH
jgi:nucleoside-diphosphate-sugar epimerase